jgi:hypothetical protein
VRLRATQRTLAAGVLAQALLWAAAVALAAERLAPGMGAIATIGVGAVVGLTVLWRGRGALSLGAAALWVEERRPELGYALVARSEGLGDAARLEAAVARVDWGGEVRRALARVLVPPLVAIGAVLVAGGVLERASAARGAGSVGGEAGSAVAGGGVGGSRIAPLTVRISPPAYSGLAAEEHADPEGISALIGSRITLSGPGSGDSVQLVAGGTLLPVMRGSGGWSATLLVPPDPLAVRLTAPREVRLLVVEPRADSIPVVALEAPAADTVFRTPAGSLGVVARATDDLGLAALWVEYIVSSGEGESFTFRSGVLATTSPSGKVGAIRAALSLGSLELKPGDLVHLRAVARDRNAVSGPGVGVSATRTLRVARAGEYDSVSVEGVAPADPEKSALSQRMLIQLTEALERRRAQLTRDVVVREAKSIARDQARLRQQVGDIVFMRLGGGDGEHSHDPNHPGHEEEQQGALTPEQLVAAAEAATSGLGEATDFHGDETPVVAINRPLLEAYNAMWAAGGELEVGEPGRALPHMRAALAAIQKARDAERIYLRGRPPAVVVDLARVRLAGNRADADPAPRTARPAADSARAERVRRFERALALLPRNAAAAADSLLLFRVQLLSEHPAAAAALGEAVSKLRAGADATDALVLARRRLAGAPAARSTLPRWGGGR